MDAETTIEDLRQLVRKFVAARNWEPFHQSKNLAMSIAIEAAELLEHFQWVTNEEGQDLLLNEEHKAEIGAELADVLIYAISFANQAGLDISQIIHDKMAKNEHRFPPDEKKF